MNVVPLKKYAYDDWCAIARQNNALREEKQASIWPINEVWQLWQALFCEGA